MHRNSPSWESWNESCRITAVVSKASMCCWVGVAVPNTKVARREHERDSPNPFRPEVQFQVEDILSTTHQVVQILDRLSLRNFQGLKILH